MAEQTDYERLSAEFRRIAGPLDFLVDSVQDGIELEEFVKSKAGQILIGRAAIEVRRQMQIILEPNTSHEKLMLAVAELRVQHRLLCAFGDVIATGRQSERLIAQGDAAAGFTTTEEEEAEL